MAHGSISIADDPDHPGHFIMERTLSGDAPDPDSVSHSMIMVLEDAVMAALEAMNQASEPAEKSPIILPGGGLL